MAEINKSKCLVCGTNIFIEIYNSLLKKCDNCGFITYNLSISSSTLKETVYTQNYFCGEEYLDYKKDKEVIQKNFQKKLKTIKSVIRKNNFPDLNNVLEIGCAYGFFGELITKEFKRVEYLGVDIVAEPIDYASNKLNLNVKKIDYLDLYKADKPYSDIFLWDVIEHLQYPGRILQKAFNELDENGRIHISTGDISRFLPRMQGVKWRMIHPPSHLHYFSKKTLSQLLSNIGFEILKINYPPISRSLKQIYYSLFLLNKEKQRNISHNVYNLIPERLCVSINTFDIMNVIAIKRPNKND